MCSDKKEMHSYSQLNNTVLSQWLYAKFDTSNVEAHFHNTHSIGIILSGECQFLTNGKEYCVKQGELVVFNPYQVHTGATFNRVLEYMMFYPSEAIVRLLDTSLPKRHLPCFRSPIVRNTELFDSIHRIINSYDLLSKQDDLRNDWLCRRIASEVLNTVETETKLIVPPEDHGGLLGKTSRYIKQNIFRSIQIESLATKMGVSRGHLSRTFKRNLGLSPSQFIRQERLRIAQTRVAAGESQVDVAHDLLFSDQAHFNREFKRITGLPPGKVVVC